VSRKASAPRAKDKHRRGPAAPKTKMRGAAAPPVLRNAKAKPPVESGAPAAMRFKPGDRVRTGNRAPKGHCRTPFYLRGQQGVIERCLGHFRNPERLAYSKPRVPKAALYTVRFPQPQLWKDYPGPATDTLVADIFDFWLEPA
jgi:nitrile hydratase